MDTLITARFFRDYLKPIEPYINNVKYDGYGVYRKKLSIEEMKRALKGVELLILEYETLNEEVLSAADKLKVIVCCRNEPRASVDVETATRKGIPVLFTSGRNAVSVAEYSFGLILSVMRNIAHTHYLLKYTDELTKVDYDDKKGKDITSEWSLDPNAPFNRYGGPELYGKSMGTIGYGAIGREVGERAVSFGMQLLIHDPYLDPAAIEQFGDNARLIDLSDLMREADIVAVNCKVTPETTGMIDRKMIGLMKPEAYFLNTARAKIVDYDALYQALKEKRIAGAALDVFPREPIEADNPFLKLDNVVLSPHLAGSGKEIPVHHSQIAVDNLLQLFNGTKPDLILNPGVLKGSGFNLGEGLDKC